MAGSGKSRDVTPLFFKVETRPRGLLGYHTEIGVEQTLGIHTMSQKGHATGMAGEFHVMALLFRLEHEPALTLGNAKSIDILTRSPKRNLYEVSVKAMRAGGKWGIGNQDYSKDKNLVFVLLHYRRFGQLSELPEIWVIPATDAEKIKRPWQNQFGLYLYKEHAHLLAPYKDAWSYLD